MKYQIIRKYNASNNIIIPCLDYFLNSLGPCGHALIFPELPRARQKTMSMLDVRTMLTPVHHGKTLVGLQLFAQPMDRAEVAHAQSYDISDRRKNTPGENELVLS